MTTTYVSIMKQIYDLYDPDEEYDMEEFKYFYGNHENSLHYYDFDISTQEETLLFQQFIIQKIEDTGCAMDMSAMKRITTKDGLKAMLLYWVMEDFADEQEQDEDMTG